MSRQYQFDPNFTNAVVNATGPKSDARLRKIVASLTRHLHDFCRENLITADDFRKAIELVGCSLTHLYKSFATGTHVAHGLPPLQRASFFFLYAVCLGICAKDWILVRTAELVGANVR